MILGRRSWRLLPSVAFVPAAAMTALLASGRQAAGDTPPPGSTAGTEQPDESLLGTIEVNGSAGLPPLPKMVSCPSCPRDRRTAW